MTSSGEQQEGMVSLTTRFGSTSRLDLISNHSVSTPLCFAFLMSLEELCSDVTTSEGPPKEHGKGLSSHCQLLSRLRPLPPGGKPVLASQLVVAYDEPLLRA